MWTPFSPSHEVSFSPPVSCGQYNTLTAAALHRHPEKYQLLFSFSPLREELPHRGPRFSPASIGCFHFSHSQRAQLEEAGFFLFYAMTYPFPRSVHDPSSTFDRE